MIDKRLLGLMEGSRRYIAISVLLQWCGLCTGILMVFTLAHFLASLLPGTTPVPFTRVAAAFVLAAVVRGLCVYGAAQASFMASKAVKKTLREKLIRKLLGLGTGYTGSVPTAEAMQLAGEGVEQLESYFGAYLPQFFYALLAPLTLFAVLAPINLKVAVVLFICVPLIPVSIVAVQKIAKRLLGSYWGQYAALSDNFLENLQGLTTLKIYQADQARHKAMNKEADHFRLITMKVLAMQLNSIIVMDVVAYGGAALGIALAVQSYAVGRVGFAGSLCIIFLSADFFLPMRTLGSFFHVAMNGMAASDKIFKLLALPEQPGRVQPLAEVRELRCEGLRFGYELERETLHGLDLTFPAGSFTALVGESGCGKSTVAALLMGRCAGYTGHITVNGAELSTILESDLMRQITLVSHNSTLFKGTVEENLRMAAPAATEAALWAALEQVRLADFLRAGQGLQTLLSEGAGNLSGGQRQRLALARALLHDSPVYIFDEATSNIDVESENDIMALILQMAKTKTVLLISHRLANVTQADNIYVLEQGTLVQSGKHAALAAVPGVYQTLWQSQQALEHFAEGVQT